MVFKAIRRLSVAQNLLVGSHKATNPKWRDGWDKIKWNKKEKEEKKDEKTSK